MKTLTPIQNVKPGDWFRSKTGRVYETVDTGAYQTCFDCCFDGPLGCCEPSCPKFHNNATANFKFRELPTCRILEETARALRDRLQNEVVSAEINGGRAPEETYLMLHELESIVGKGVVKL